MAPGRFSRIAFAIALVHGVGAAGFEEPCPRGDAACPVAGEALLQAARKIHGQALQQASTEGIIAEALQQVLDDLDAQLTRMRATKAEVDAEVAARWATLRNAISNKKKWEDSEVHKWGSWLREKLFGGWSCDSWVRVAQGLCRRLKGPYEGLLAEVSMQQSRVREKEDEAGQLVSEIVLLESSLQNKIDAQSMAQTYEDLIKSKTENIANFTAWKAQRQAEHQSRFDEVSAVHAEVLQNHSDVITGLETALQHLRDARDHLQEDAGSLIQGTNASSTPNPLETAQALKQKLENLKAELAKDIATYQSSIG